jgi:hypothetical protein
MRQGGMKPKGHNSGTYWVRANAQNGKKGTKEKKNLKADNQIGIDADGDGEIDYYVDEGIYTSPMQLWVDVIWRMTALIGGIIVVFALIFF